MEANYMKKVLQISPTLALPLEAITEKQAFLGRTGQGKSYAAQKEAGLIERPEPKMLRLTELLALS
jgi:hypothetical protein